MSAELPSPVDLSPPPENPAGIEAVISTLDGAAFSAELLADHLTGPAASAPGWLGADASAAAEQVTRTAAVARDVHQALTTAVGRLSAHHELLTGAVRRLHVLQAEQREEFTAAQLEFARLDGSGWNLPLGGPEAATVVERFRAAESARAREHARLTADVARDAGETAGVLDRAGQVVGGTGAPGDIARVLRHLAHELPGWGVRELASLGTGLAERLSGTATRDQLERFAAEASPYLSEPAFARALLLGLGPDGVRYLLTTLGQSPGAAPGPLAALLAGALHSVVPAPAGVAADADPLTRVLLGSYVDSSDPDVVGDRVVAGLGMVLAAAGTLSLPGSAVAEWGRQMLARERAQGAPAGDRLRFSDAPDPVVVVVDRLVEDGDPAAAAALLSSRSSWDALLHRTWDDGGAALSALVGTAGRDTGPAGSVAVFSGLEALGAGLTAQSGGQWTVDRQTAARTAAAMGDAVSAHLDVVTGLLRVGLPGAGFGIDEDTALRGLGYLTADPQAARAVDDALVGWAREHPQPPSPDALPLTGAAALGSYVAVRQYGQRLAFALHGAQEAENAVDRQLNWLFFVSLPSKLARGLPGAVLDALVGFGARHFRADGSWDNGVDRGQFFGPQDAADNARTALTLGNGPEAAEQLSQATSAFDRTGAVLGTPRPPTPPQPVADNSELPSIEREMFPGGR